MPYDPEPNMKHYDEECDCHSCDKVLLDVSGTKIEVTEDDETVLRPGRLNEKQVVDLVGHGEHALGSLLE